MMSVSVQYEHLHTILYTSFFIGFGVCVGERQCERTIRFPEYLFIVEFPEFVLDLWIVRLWSRPWRQTVLRPLLQRLWETPEAQHYAGADCSSQGSAQWWTSCPGEGSLSLQSVFITGRKRSLGQGNVFTPVSFCSQRRGLASQHTSQVTWPGVYIRGELVRPPWALQDMANKWAVCILL